MIKVKDILTMPSMKDSQLLSGMEGVNKEIRNISVMETPDFETWAQPKTILLTSLYATQDFSYNEQEDLMNRMSRTDISAFIIKTEAYVKKVPQGIIAGGKLHGIPIIQISKDTSYNAVTHDVMQVLFNEENKILNYYRDMYEKFMMLSLDGEESESIVQSLEKIIDRPVMLYDDNENVVISSRKDIPFQLEGAVQTRNLNDYLIAYESPEAYTTMIQLDDLKKMYLFVSTHKYSLKDNEKIAIHIAASFIKLNYVKNLAIKEKRQQRYLQAIDALLHNTELSFHERESRLETLAMSTQKKFLIIVVDNGSSAPQVMHNFDDRLTLHLYGKVKLVKFRIQESQVAVILEGSNESMEQNIYYDLITLFTPDFGICVGISELVNHTLDFPKAYTQAKDALEIGKHLYTNHEKHIFSHTELGIHRTLFKLQKKVPLENYMNPKLKKLINTDYSSKEELIVTLTVFLDEKQNYKNTSNKLSVHWKTVKNRILKIEEITGINLNKAEEVLDIHLSLKILNLV